MTTTEKKETHQLFQNKWFWIGVAVLLVLAVFYFSKKKSEEQEPEPEPQPDFSTSVQPSAPINQLPVLFKGTKYRIKPTADTSFTTCYGCVIHRSVLSLKENIHGITWVVDDIIVDGGVFYYSFKSSGHLDGFNDKYLGVKPSSPYVEAWSDVKTYFKLEKTSSGFYKMILRSDPSKGVGSKVEADNNSYLVFTNVASCVPVKFEMA